MAPWHKRLAAARRRARLTQAEVAERARIHRTTYVHYEAGRGRPDVFTAIAIARALGRTVEELFGAKALPRRKRSRTLRSLEVE